MSRSRPAGDRWWLVALGCIVLLLALLATRWTFDMWTWQPDELLYRGSADWIADHLPRSLWEMDLYRRGTQRLNVFLYAATLDTFGSPAGFRVARWVVILAFAATSFPVFALARRAGARPPWALLAGVLAVTVPWVGMSGTFLTEAFAYPLYALACLAIWWAAADPGNRRDLIALAVIAAAMLARTGLVVLIGALVIAVLGSELRWRPSPAGRQLGDVLRRHAVLSAVVVLAAGVKLAGAATAITGRWYGGASVTWDRLPDAAGYTVGVIGAGLLFVPMVAALTLTIGELARPRDRERLALGLVVAGALVTTLITMASAHTEERYVFYAAAPCLAAFAVLASGGGARTWHVVTAGGVLAVAVLSRSWAAGHDYWTYLTWPGPAQTFQADVVRDGISAKLSWSQGSSGDLVVAALLSGATLLVLAFAARRPAGGSPWRNVAAVAAGGMLVLGSLAQTHWALRKFVDAGGGGRPLAERTALDSALGSRSAGVWLPPATVGYSHALWSEARYFSRRLRGTFRLGGSQRATVFPGERRTRVTIDPRTGLVRARDGRPLPDLMAQIASQVTAPLAGSVVARDQVLGIDVVRSGPRPRVAWTFDGVWADGWLPPARVATLRIPAAGRARCVRSWLIAAGAGPVRLLVTPPGGRTQTVALAPGQERSADLRLGSGTQAGVLRLEAHGRPGRQPDGRLSALRVIPMKTAAACRPSA